MAIRAMVSGDMFGSVGSLIQDNGTFKRVFRGMLGDPRYTFSNGDALVGIGPGGRRGIRLTYPRWSFPVPLHNPGNLYTGTDEVVAHFSFAAEAFDTTWNGNVIATFFAPGDSEFVNLHYNHTSRLLEVRRGTTVLATAVTEIQPATFYHIGWRVRFHDSAGEVDLWVDETQEINATSLDTISAATSYRNPVQLRLGAAFNSDAWVGCDDVTYADIVVVDDTGPAPFNAYLGRKGVEVLYPNADSAEQDWTRSAGGATHSLIGKEQDADIGSWGTDFIDGGLGDQAICGLPNLSTTSLSNVTAVSLFCVGERLDATPDELRLLARLSVTEDIALGSGPAWAGKGYQIKHLPTKPGGGAWTETDLNNLEVGVEIA